MNPVTYSTTPGISPVTTPLGWTGLLLLAVVLGACSGSADLTKLDAGLRTELDQMDDDAVVECLVGLAADAPDDAHTQLEDAGLQVRTVAGDVVTVNGTAEAVRRATRFAWVVRIEPSRVRMPASSG